MKMQLVRAIAAAAALLMAALAGTQSGTPVEIKSVDNYAGNSNVYTNAPNTTITVVELDADKKPVRSWTGTTDSDGKLTIPAGHVLSKEYLRAHRASTMAEFVTPSALEADMPFTFAATGTVEGAVVQVYTVEGEVVAARRADEHGRVFIPAGLAVGTYLVTVTNRGHATIGNLNVPQRNPKPKPTPMPGYPSETVSLNFERIPSTTNIADQIALTGQGINPDATSLNAWIETPAANERFNRLTVLAACSNEVILEAPAKSGAEAGPMQLLVQDMETGETAATNPFVGYTASAQLSRRTVMSGEQTELVVSVQPAGLEATVHARIVAGPVTFANGASEASQSPVNGIATFPVLSQSGRTGDLRIAWSVLASESQPLLGSELGRHSPSSPWIQPVKSGETSDSASARQDKAAKHKEKAREAEKAAEAAEEAAKGAAAKGAHGSAAAKSKDAAEKRAEAAAHIRAAGDAIAAAEQERKAAGNSRAEAEAIATKGGNKAEENDARRRAAEAETRAAADEARQAKADAKTDKAKAADAYDRAADAHDRAAADYRKAGEASKAAAAERAAKAAREQAAGLRK
jgi:hypothetical protein